ncbi:MAG: pyridoxal-phosphate dependent enzyme [Desulfobacterales bacterium]|nr:pyridoxal-phosphate dependent enzyme [Desulfobacterales bacterium]
MLAPVFPMNIIEQEVSPQRWIDIPEEVLEIYAIWRPSPLIRATAPRKGPRAPRPASTTSTRASSPPGSHKPNTAVPQAYYNKVFGIKRLTTETGAGQWGSALAFACAQFGLECKVYMVRISFDQKPYRKTMMQTWGATCIPSPSTETKAGRDILAQHPDTPGSLGIAISEAVEAAVTDTSGQTRYSLGSVLNHVHAAPDHHRPGSQEAVREDRRNTRTWSSAAPAAAATSPGSPSRSCCDKINGKQGRHPSRSSRPPAPP